MPIEEASMKSSTGPPSDDGSADADLPTWAVVTPGVTRYGTPEGSPGLKDGIPLAESARRLLSVRAPAHRKGDSRSTSR